MARCGSCALVPRSRSSGLIEITGTVTLDGANGDGEQIVLDGQQSTQLFLVTGSGNLTLTAMTLQHGSADLALGGAIHNSGTLTIEQSTFTGNQAGNDGGAIDGNGPFEITASTFSDNRAGDGSALWVESGGVIRWSTIIQPADTGVALYLGSGVLSLEGVILGGEGVHCATDVGPMEARLDDSYSLANDDSCGLVDNGSRQGVEDLGLSGPTPADTLYGVTQIIYEPQAGSPAIDMGGTSCAGTADQVGTARPQQLACDIGAIETDLVGLDPVDLCANRWNGSLRMPGGACGGNELLIVLPDDGPVTICANAWNGDARYSPSGSCGWSETPYEATGDDSIPVCINRWNGGLRVSEVCSSSERSEAI